MRGKCFCLVIIRINAKNANETTIHAMNVKAEDMQKQYRGPLAVRNKKYMGAMVTSSAGGLKADENLACVVRIIQCKKGR